MASPMKATGATASCRTCGEKILLEEVDLHECDEDSTDSHLAVVFTGEVLALTPRAHTLAPRQSAGLVVGREENVDDGRGEADEGNASATSAISGWDETTASVVEAEIVGEGEVEGVYSVRAAAASRIIESGASRLSALSRASVRAKHALREAHGRRAPLLARERGGFEGSGDGARGDGVSGVDEGAKGAANEAIGVHEHGDGYGNGYRDGCMGVESVTTHGRGIGRGGGHPLSEGWPLSPHSGAPLSAPPPLPAQHRDVTNKTIQSRVRGRRLGNRRGSFESEACESDNNDGTSPFISSDSDGDSTHNNQIENCDGDGNGDGSNNGDEHNTDTGAFSELAVTGAAGVAGATGAARTARAARAAKAAVAARRRRNAAAVKIQFWWLRHLRRRAERLAVDGAEGRSKRRAKRRAGRDSRTLGAAGSGRRRGSERGERKVAEGKRGETRSSRIRRAKRRVLDDHRSLQDKEGFCIVIGHILDQAMAMDLDISDPERVVDYYVRRAFICSNMWHPRDSLLVEWCHELAQERFGAAYRSGVENGSVRP